jgi:hypothetical protein
MFDIHRSLFAVCHDKFDENTPYTHSPYVQSTGTTATTTDNEQENPYRPKSSAPVHYQHANRPSSMMKQPAVQYFDSLATSDLIDPLQTQFMQQTSSTHVSDAQNQLNKFRILCNVKDRKINELEHRCTEYSEKYTSDIRALKHKVELSESKSNVHVDL